MPFHAITNIPDNRIFLNVRKDQIGSMGWHERPSEAMSTGTATTEADRTIRLREEQLQATKRPVETGSVHLGKDVVEEQRTMDVPVSREEVYVERHSVDRRPSDRPVEAADHTIEVPVREEQVQVEKQPVVYEEVGVGKRQLTENQPVSETVRREEARIEKEGDVDVSGTEATDKRPA